MKCKYSTQLQVKTVLKLIISFNCEVIKTLEEHL